MAEFRQFISFEGIDYSGKTTQLKLLLARLQQSGIDAQLLREPGGTVISEKIREILLDKSHTEMHAKAEILLYSAARVQLVHQKLLPLLQSGATVIADRFFDSTTVYQGFGRNLDLTFVRSLNTFATSGLMPYKTFLIDISPDEALRRRQHSGRGSDRLDSESLTFFQAIHTAYHQLANDFPNRFVIISGERDVDSIAVEIWKKICELWTIA